MLGACDPYALQMGRSPARTLSSALALTLTSTVPLTLNPNPNPDPSPNLNPHPFVLQMGSSPGGYDSDSALLASGQPLQAAACAHRPGQ